MKIKFFALAVLAFVGSASAHVSDEKTRINDTGEIRVIVADISNTAVFWKEHTSIQNNICDKKKLLEIAASSNNANLKADIKAGLSNMAFFASEMKNYRKKHGIAFVEKAYKDGLTLGDAGMTYPCFQTAKFFISAFEDQK